MNSECFNCGSENVRLTTAYSHTSVYLCNDCGYRYSDLDDDEEEDVFEHIHRRRSRFDDDDDQ